MGNKNSGRRPFKDPEEIRKNNNLRALRYYHNKKEKALNDEEAQNIDFINKFKYELNMLFFAYDMDNLNADSLRFRDIKQVKINKDVNVYLVKINNNYIWRYKNIVSDLMSLEKALKDAKRTLA